MSDEAVQQTENLAVLGLYRGRPRRRHEHTHRVSQQEFASIVY
jgi:hypothetical protein